MSGCHGWGWRLPTPNCVPSCRYYSDIRQSSPASYQEMNSALAELSGVRHGPGYTPLHLGNRAEGGGLGLEVQAGASAPQCAAPRITPLLPTVWKLCKNSTNTSTGIMTR